MEKSLENSSLGRGHVLPLLESAYKELMLTDQQEQRLYENLASLEEGVQKLIRGIIASKYEKEIEFSKFVYPEESKEPEAITNQINTIAKEFNLDPVNALEFIKTPFLFRRGTRWFAVPKLSAITKKYFPEVTEEREQYCKAVKLVLEKLTKNGRVTNQTKINNEIVPNRLHQNHRTKRFLKQIETSQQGDILVIEAQHGEQHGGESARRARENFRSNEFGLGVFAVGCMMLTQTQLERNICELGIECVGDEMVPEDHNNFTYAHLYHLRIPYFWLDKTKGLCLYVGSEEKVSQFCGSASAFVQSKDYKALMNL